MLRKQLLDTSRGRIVTLLQRAALTVDDVASKLSLTASAVRVQMTAMERDGVIRRVGRRPGATRPSQLFELTPEVEQLLSRAYIPLLTHLIREFTLELPGHQVAALLRAAGKGLAEELSPASRPTGRLRSRVAAAIELLNTQLGALTHFEENTGCVIRGDGCPLAALTGKHPAVCLSMESLLKQFIGVSVRECCDRSERPRCRFEIGPETHPSSRAAGRRPARPGRAVS
ncbi:MAG: helix-turn-helix transcriptional regulator [Vicinamibacterales bacterium]